MNSDFMTDKDDANEIQMMMSVVPSKGTPFVLPRVYT